ncbi:hypothetical protein [Candidatus Galacturonibacter soehngenii]|uniref:Pentapeptide repeat-containing protein n=1 Tax=Candidatus Galacturonatibacter soehngenii TaxID=2307010 RepID=A0A7V7QK25_9FIRM|nr:hypothetical protein [Candidatus Galacturonibacter soehngenii]KAB1438032.1 hypothetical protein F7O84_10680 [Candidatus Galacturonibacter soehngenii]
MEKIRIVDDRYRLLCEVEDGKQLKVWKTGKEAEAIIKPCTYLDEYHFQHGQRVFHICQFGEWLKQEGYQVKPYGYSLDYKKYQNERYFGHDYYCLEKNGHAAFYYNPQIEQPFMVRKTDEFGRLESSIPYAGDTLVWVCGYDHEKAEWGIPFDMEKIKNLILIHLPKTVKEAEKMELEAQLNQMAVKRIDLQEAYVERDLLEFEEREKLLEEVYQMDHAEPPLLMEERLKKEYAEEIIDSQKVFAGKDFRGCDFTGIDISGYAFLQCDLTSAVLEPELFKNTYLAGCQSNCEQIQEMQQKKPDRENRKGI